MIAHKALGAVLFFDPTHPLIPLGYLPGALQANYGMLVTPAGGELIALPQTASALNGVERMATLTLDENGRLSGTCARPGRVTPRPISVTRCAARSRTWTRSSRSKPC